MIYTSLVFAKQV